MLSPVRSACLACVSLFAATAAMAVDVRAVDEQVFAMMVEARDVRWAVVEAPIGESDRRQLARRADEVYDELVDLQRSLLRGRSDSHLCGEAEDVHEAVCDLRETLARRPRVVGYGGRTCGTGVGDPFAAIVAHVEHLHQTTEGLHALIMQGPGYGTGYPPSATPLPQPVQPTLPQLPPPTFETPTNYPPTTYPPANYPPANYGWSRPGVPSDRYGAPDPRTFDVSRPPAGTIVLPREVDPPRGLRAPTARTDKQRRVETGLRTLGWVLSQIDD